MLTNKPPIKISRLKIAAAENEKTMKWLAEEPGRSKCAILLVTNEVQGSLETFFERLPDDRMRM